MFTGIVTGVGRITAREERGGDLCLTVALSSGEPRDLHPGDSVCVQGCCLTVAALQGAAFMADLSRETLALTTLGELPVGAAVNLEPALRAGVALGGHLVSGHVDGVGAVIAAAAEARSLRVTIAAPAALARYLAPKGSVTVDGVSLTINEAAGASFGVNLIPHTAQTTTLGALVAGSRVNLEVDQIARYLARLVEAGQA